LFLLWSPSSLNMPSHSEIVKLLVYSNIIKCSKKTISYLSVHETSPIARCTIILNEIDNNLYVYGILIKCVIIRVVQNGYTTKSRMVVFKLVQIIAYINLKCCIAILGPSVHIGQTWVTSPIQQEVDCLFSRFDILYEVNTNTEFPVFFFGTLFSAWI
jgi:hypothetical protein